MFLFNDLKSIHLEITNNCQASCPMCGRNNHGGLPNSLIKIKDWSLTDFKSIMTKEVLDQIESFYFCGNYGDPLLNNSLLKMCEYAKSTNPDLEIRIHTNGSLRDKKWWRRLYEVLPKNHCVIFAIDGLENTHGIYRIGTDYNKIIENAKEFISAGGIAEWAFIKFLHNEHQVEEAKKLSQDLGFKYFYIKNSSRFLIEPKFDVFDKTGKPIYKLQPSSESPIKFIDRKIIEKYEEIVKTTDIDCMVLKSKEIYIDAYKHVFPCCFVAAAPYSHIDSDSALSTVKKRMFLEYEEIVNRFGGIENIDASKITIKEIINSETYQTIWYEYWEKKQLVVCARTCGKTDLFSNPLDQFEN
jgi:MoaA/NifB/PqqE/SkfB family radical SAM enzyme